MSLNINNIELKTVSKVLTSTASQIVIGDQVPSGMKRFVTFVKLDNIGVNASKVGVYLASVNTSQPTKASVTATSNRKMLLHLRATGVIGYRKTPLTVPEKPSFTPLFTIAGGNFLGAYATNTTAILTVQYYDE